MYVDVDGEAGYESSVVSCDETSRVEAPTDPQPSAERERTRRPYRAPQLRKLGSVRDLTHGSAVGMIEGAGTFRNVM